MLHPEEQTVSEPAGKGSSVLMAVLLFITIAAIAAMGYMRSQGVELKNIDIRQLFAGNNVKLLNDTSEITEIPYDSKEHPSFGIHMEYIVKCTHDGIWLLDKKGREIWSVGAPLGNPLVKTNGRDLLVVDIGGRDIFVINGKNVRWKEKSGENILNAEISKDGYVTVITESELYNGEVLVYDSNGIELLKSVIANDFAVTAKIAPSGKLMVTDLINASDVKAITSLKFSDLNGNELAKKSMPREKGLYPFIWFTEDDAVFAAGNTSIVFMDKGGNVKWEKQFQKVISTSTSSSKRIAAAVINGNRSELKVYTTAGNEYSHAELKEEALNINAFEGVIAVNTGRSAVFYTEKGKSKGIYNAKSDINQVLFFTKQQAAVITKNNIAVIDIK